MDLTQRLPEDVSAEFRRTAWRRLAVSARPGTPSSTLAVCWNSSRPRWPACSSATTTLKSPSSSSGLREIDAAVSGRLDYAPTEAGDTGMLDHCNGLLLFCTYVANPATRRWAPLPQPPSGFGSRHIVFDPAVSPHYEVFKIPRLPRFTTGVELQLEWPPSPFIMPVFSSTTGNWEERSFARQGDAIGTVAHLQELARWSITQDYSVYWCGQLYVLSQFVMRINLSDCTYQAIEPPVDVGMSEEKCSLGRSENGVYLASIDRYRRLRVWILNELHGEFEWVLKHDNNLDHMLSRGMYDPQVQGPWSIEDINYNSDHSTYPINMQEAAEDDIFEWNSDNENTLDTRLEVGKRYTGSITVLGFHPYKEVLFLNESVMRGLAYHLNSSKLEDLGNIYPKDYSSIYML